MRGCISFASVSLFSLSMSVTNTSGLICPALIFWMPSSMLLKVVYSTVTSYFAPNSFKVFL